MPRDAEKIAFLCRECGHASPKWNGRCTSCDAWGTVVAFAEPRGGSVRAGGPRAETAAPLVEQPRSDGPRLSTGLGEFDRLLGGGLVAGSVLLLAGDPGVGKSTLLLQAAGRVAEGGRCVLYVSGEESGAQVRLRGERLGVRSPGVLFAAETDAEAIGRLLERAGPDLLIVDSVQTLTASEVPSTAGSVTQVRECAQFLIGRAKSSDVPTVMTGHVTKDGNIAGPRVLEHMVDVVLAMEGASIGSLRLLRCAKNRFGATNDVALFEMGGDGLAEAPDPSAVLVGERDPAAPGSAVAVTMEGSRPLLCEVQALTNASAFAPPRRSATGVDFNRMAMLAAVLSRRAGIGLANQDVAVNLPGGLRIGEPALDLAIAVSIASSCLDAPIDPRTVLVGEVGLNGEIRSTAHLDRRLAEAARLGFERALVPGGAARTLPPIGGIHAVGVETLRNAIAAATGTRAERRPRRPARQAPGRLAVGSRDVVAGGGIPVLP